MIYTASFFSPKDYRGRPISIANSKPLGTAEFAGMLTCRSLVPRWSIVDDLKKGRIDWTEYTKLYLDDLITDNVIEEVRELYSGVEDITLCCWESSPLRCHRSLAQQWLSEHGFAISR